MGMRLIVQYLTATASVLAPALMLAQEAPKAPPPEDDRWIEVRFSEDGKQLRCKRFEIEITVGDRLLLSGKFRDGFPIRDQLAELLVELDKDPDIRARCGRLRWSLPAGQLRPVPAVWTFAFDHRPYTLDWQKEIERRGDPVWIESLTIAPISGSLESYHFRACTAAYKNVKPGPCFDDWQKHREEYPEKWGVP